VRSLGPARILLPALQPGTAITDCTGALIVPGFVDTHIHYAQTDVIASGGETLIDWLERYTYPAERRFGDPVHARGVAEFFLDELLKNGTTTALVLGTVHRQSADAFFEAAAARNLRMVAGKALMDRHCPDYLRDTPESGYRESSELLERWGGAGRLGYAITPRFAATSSAEQLALAGKLAREHPDAHIHSHVAENVKEVAWIRELFPANRSYLDVYDSFGLLRARAVYAHCIHLDAADRRRMARSGAAAAFCPTSNLFLGSGLFDLAAADDAGVKVGVGTDVGGGTSFSMLRTLAEAYKVAQLSGQRLSATRAFYLATLGGAGALALDDRIGNFLPGREADFMVLDPAATPLAARRMQAARTLEEKLFILMTLGDDRMVRQTYVMGRAMLASR
jgi:guanine deaminase